MQGGPRQHTGLGRREFALYSTQLLPLAALLSGTDDAKTIVNSVLGNRPRKISPCSV